MRWPSHVICAMDIVQSIDIRGVSDLPRSPPSLHLLPPLSHRWVLHLCTWWWQTDGQKGGSGDGRIIDTHTDIVVWLLPLYNYPMFPALSLYLLQFFLFGAMAGWGWDGEERGRGSSGCALCTQTAHSQPRSFIHPVHPSNHCYSIPHPYSHYSACVVSLLHHDIYILYMWCYKSVDTFWISSNPMLIVPYCRTHCHSYTSIYSMSISFSLSIHSLSILFCDRRVIAPCE